MVLTLKVTDDLAARLRPHEEELPRILEFGLREVSADRLRGFEGVAEVLETLASLPTPEEVLALRPSTSFQERIDALLEKNRVDGLSQEEEREWERYQYLEHLVRLAKAKAKGRLGAA
ncbi:MAG: hypothetical protein GY719_39465 [bacterium]|nr:hypothetical protein [bacterium]